MNCATSLHMRIGAGNHMEANIKTRALVQRNHGVDWLRTGCILLLFPFHTARVFDGWEPNYIKDTVNSFSSWFVFLTSYWFMPLMFVIAGISAYYALQKRAPGQYVKERFLRLLVPFLVGILLIVPIQGYLASVQQYGYTGGYLNFLPSYFTDFSDLSGYTGSFTPAHLWFLLYLFMISTALLPVLLRIKKSDGQKPNFWAKPALLLFAFVPLTIASALPGIGGKNPFYFAVFFLMGYWLAHRNLLDTLKNYRIWYFIGALFAGACYVIGGSLLQFASGYTVEAAIVELLRDAAAWLMILALIGLAQAYANKPGKALNYCNGASFPVYILHQSVMMAVAFYVVTWTLPVWVKFLLISILSLFLSLAGYEALRRFKATRALFGMK